MEWTPSSIRTYIDGQQIWVMDISNPSSFSGEEFHAPHFFILNLAVGGSFTGIFSSSGISATLPAEYRIDYVRLYDNGHTILNSPFPGTSYCSGDEFSCPCANAGDGGSGCANSSSMGGTLSASGSASVSTDDLTLSLNGGLSGQPCLFFQGDNKINGGDGVIFGDGLRCAGGGVIRLQVRFADATGLAQTSVDLAAAGGCAVCDMKRYQGWYRDPNTSLCGSDFNLSNGVEFVWTP